MSALPLGRRKVVVTGGGTGIGRAAAEKLLEAGGQVALVGRREDKLRETAARFGGRAIPLPCDLTSPQSRRGLLKKAKDAMGGLDGLVQCAGVVEHQPLGQIEERSLREQLEVNFVAPLRLGEEALVEMEDGGAVVFVSSTLALRPVRTSAVYSAAKAGTLALMRAFALEAAPRGIRANAVCPGMVETDMTKARLATGRAALSALHPLGIGQPQDAAEAIFWLLGAPWTTGAQLVVDGGLLLHE
jgi:3-oxoacyl-[acyl-carrier protein] reductase